MNNNCMETMPLESSDLKKCVTNSSYYPFLEQGLLIPFLDDENILFDFYIKANKRKPIKQFCKKFQWEGKPDLPRIVDDQALKVLIRSMCNSADAREKLVKRDNGCELYHVIWSWLRREHSELFKKIFNICFENKESSYYIDIDKLKELLVSDEGILKHKLPLAYIIIAFAMLQKKERFTLGFEIFNKYPDLASDLMKINKETVEASSTLVKKKLPNYTLKEKSSDLPISQKTDNWLIVNSIDELIEHQRNLEKVMAEFVILFDTFSEGIKQLPVLNRSEDFTDSGSLTSTLEDLQLNRTKIKYKSDEVKKLLNLGCKQPNCQKCKDFGLYKIIELRAEDSIQSVIKKGDLQNEQLKKSLDKVSSARIEVEKLKLKELKLIASANLKDDYFQIKMNDSSPCELIDEAEFYHQFVNDLELQVNDILAKSKNNIMANIEELKCQKGTVQCTEYLKELSSIKLKISNNNTLNELEIIEDNLKEILIKYTDHSDNVREISLELMGVNPINLKRLLELCYLLVIQKKSCIAFMLLYAYQNKREELSENSELAIELLIETTFNSQKNGLSQQVLFNQLFARPRVFNYLNSNLSNNELSERLIIILVMSSIMGHTDSSAMNLLQINASEICRLNLPKYLEELVVAMISQQTVKVASENVLRVIASQEEAIEEKIAIEDGKYRHTQRGGKHFARFEALYVYPALEKFWKNIFKLIKNSDFIKAKSILDLIDVSDWYQQLVSEYDKPLMDHRHFSTATRNFMESFIESIKEYFSYSKNEFGDGSVVYVEPKFIGSLEQWSGGDKSRVSLIDNIKKLIGSKNSNKVEKTFFHSIIQCPQILLNCPNFILWLRKQRNPSDLSDLSDLMPIILSDLSKEYHFNVAKDLYLNNYSWESISIIIKPTDKKAAKDYQAKFEIDKKLVLEKNYNIKDLNDNKLITLFDECIKEGRIPAAYKIIEQCDEEIDDYLTNEKDILLNFVNELLSNLNNIKEEAAKLNMSETWLDSVYIFTMEIEKKLRGFLHNDTHKEALDLDRTRVYNAIEALKSVVDSSSNSFEEVEIYLSKQKVVSYDLENIKGIALEKCHELITLWDDLSSKTLVDETEIKRAWNRLVKEFAKKLNLYHDQNDEKKRFGTLSLGSLNYTFPIFQTAFYKPQSEFLKRPVRLYLYRSNVDLPTLKRLEAELSSEDSVSFLHIIFVPQDYMKVERFFKYDKGFKNFLLINEEFLHKMASEENHEIPLRQSLHASVLDLANSSPFVSQGYCHQSNNIYVGRKDILQKLLNNPQAMIWGGRRIGKTSVLHALESALNRRNYKVAYVYVDIQGNGDPDLAIAQKIALTLDLGLVKSIAVFERKISSLRRKGVKIAFLIDEVDEYIKKSRSVYGSEFPLATVLRQLIMDDPDKDTFLVYSGYHQLYYEAKLNQEKRRVGHPFINIAQQIPIRDLTYDDINDLVKIGFVDMLGIKVHPAVPLLIAKKASRHPAFVQQYCRCLLEYVSNRRTLGTPVTITVNDVEAVYNINVNVEGGEQAFINYFHETLGYNLSHLGHAILLAVSDPEFNKKNMKEKYFLSEDILSLLNEWCNLLQIQPPKSEHFHQTIELLVMTNMLTQDPNVHGRYRATYPTHLDILKRLDKINKSAIEDSLKEYDQKERDKGVLL